MLDPTSGAVRVELPGVNVLAPTADPARVVAVFDRGDATTIGLYDIANHEPVGAPVDPGVSLEYVATDGQRAYVIGDGGTRLRTVNLAAGRLTEPSLDLTQSATYLSVVTGDSGELYVVHFDVSSSLDVSTIQRLDTRTGAVIASSPPGYTQLGTGGGRIVAVTNDGMIAELDRQTLQPVGAVFPGTVGGVLWIDVDTSGQRVALLGGDETARVFDVEEPHAARRPDRPRRDRRLTRYVTTATCWRSRRPPASRRGTSIPTTGSPPRAKSLGAISPRPSGTTTSEASPNPAPRADFVPGVDHVRQTMFVVRFFREVAVDRPEPGLGSVAEPSFDAEPRFVDSSRALRYRRGAQALWPHRRSGHAHHCSARSGPNARRGGRRVLLQQRRLRVACPGGREPNSILSLPVAAPMTGSEHSGPRNRRLGVGAGAQANAMRAGLEGDARPFLASVRVPTLVLHREGNRFIRIGAGRYIAEHIDGATFVALPGDDHLLFAGDSDARVDEIEEFLTGTHQAPEGDVVTAAVLFTDIVASTEQAAHVGHRPWTALLDAHNATVRATLDRYRGREIKTIGDGFLATFDATTRAVRAAIEIVAHAQQASLDVRAGVHSGEIEILPDDVAGLAVTIAKRVCDLADPGTVLVSETVKGQLVGTGITTSPHGTHTLKGVPDQWHLYTVTTPSHNRPL